MDSDGARFSSDWSTTVAAAKSFLPPKEPNETASLETVAVRKGHPTRRLTARIAPLTPVGTPERAASALVVMRQLLSKWSSRCMVDGGDGMEVFDVWPWFP